ncbi:MAG: bacillithiol biosynthesis cysteine-adding enzyme BshC [Bacteroidia bacterium]|nr:bacillithiol biosynthesis cysteine-adding enzyme BshC [Bacteroidia bacterium]
MITLKKSKIPLVETGQFSKLFLDYIKGDSVLRKHYAYEPKIEGFQQVIEDKAKENTNRPLLVTVLREQYSTIEAWELQKNNIDLLLNKNTFTVCTGHQLCLFTGPLYFIYKIISTINLAETLKKNYPEYNFVPVYWMASEDHDFAEVRSINLFGKKISWNMDAKGAVGNLKTDSLNLVIDELKQILGESENSKELIQLFTDAYLKNINLSDATRYIVHHLFAQYGLVILDGNDKRLKNEFSEIIKDDIINNTNYRLVNETISELERAGFKAQVNPRVINCFYMIDNLRERIEHTHNTTLEEGRRDVFNVVNTSITFTKDELLKELTDHPERFSPNVVLRPVYQQKILPNLAYIGGPGELAYWLEYKRMFDHHNINFPVLIPRNFALLTDEKTNQQIQKLGFTINELFKDVDVLIKEFVNKNANFELSLKEQEEKISNVFAEVSQKAMAVDVTLKGSVEAELQKALNALKNLESKLVRSEKQKQETNINQIKKVKEKFFPEGALQERYENMTPYYLRSGKKFIADLKEQFDPLDYELSILTIN